MKTPATISLTALYKYINDALKGSAIANDGVTIKARVKLPDEKDRIVELKVIGVSIAKEKLSEEESNKMSGMYPPTEKATIYIDCETMKEEKVADEHKGS